MSDKINNKINKHEIKKKIYLPIKEKTLLANLKSFLKVTQCKKLFERNGVLSMKLKLQKTTATKEFFVNNFRKVIINKHDKQIVITVKLAVNDRYNNRKYVSSHYPKLINNLFPVRLL